jgi:hypothetical protein
MKAKYLFNLIACLILLLSGGVAQAAQISEPAATGNQGMAPGAHIANPFASPDWFGEIDLNTAIFGASVASAGDVNGDGYADVIVGAPYYHNGQDMEGGAFVYHGSATGLKPLPSWSFESNQTECQVGWSVASAGDVNGDGYDDVLVASEFCGTGAPNREGRVYLFLGSASGLAATHAWMLQGGGFDESLGMSIASAGDVNRDGYGDVIVGAPWASYPEGHEGRAYVFYGSASGLPATANWTAESNVAWSGFGVSVASAGDVNGDGFNDVIIGHNGMSNPQEGEGRAYVYLGSATGLAAAPAWMYENDLALSGLGESVASAGDVNGDGYGDVIVGGFKYSNPETKEGVAYLFLGSATGLAWTPAWHTESEQAYAEYGQSVASAGDVNQDGYDDVLVGAPWYSNGENYEGRVYLYFGSPTGLMDSPVYMAESNQEAAHLGYSAVSAGDVNGDGIADIIVGAKDYDGGQGNEGRATLYYGLENVEHMIFVPLIQQ